jgi:hypothetical protein
MKKFVFLYHAFPTQTEDTSAAWMAWFASVGDKMVDVGNPFGAGREVTKTGSKELSAEMGAASGYSIVNANSFEEAEKILEGCPEIGIVRVYEAMPM